jgi:hypothetical protein
MGWLRSVKTRKRKFLDRDDAIVSAHALKTSQYRAFLFHASHASFQNLHARTHALHRALRAARNASLG